MPVYRVMISSVDGCKDSMKIKKPGIGMNCKKGQRGDSHLHSLSLLPFVVKSRAISAGASHCVCELSYDQQH